MKDLSISGTGTSLSKVEAYRTQAYPFSKFQSVITDLQGELKFIKGITFKPGQRVVVPAEIKNVGANTRQPILVKFYQGDPLSGGTQIGKDRVINGLGEGRSVLISENWSAPLTTGTYNLFVVVNPNRTIIEFDYANNRALKTVSVK